MMYKKQWTRKEILRLISAPLIISLASSFDVKAVLRSPPFKQNPLPYAIDALEPYIDAKTMEIHYGKHASAYCANLNNALDNLKLVQTPDLETILQSVSSYAAAVRNNGGGHYNHELFWSCMIPGGTPLQEGALKSNLLKKFGSLNNFQQSFSDLALNRFGSGWVWLYLDQQNELKIDSTPNQDNPLMDISPVKGYPLLCLDVWEHAYYLTYQNRRAEYIRQWWNIVNWSFVSERYNKRTV